MTMGHKCDHVFSDTKYKKKKKKEPPPQNGQQPKSLGGLKAFYWYQIFALDSAVVEVQEMFGSHGRLLTIAMLEEPLKSVT